MQTDFGHRPAALAVLFYVLGLVAAPELVSYRIAAGGLIVVAALLCVSRFVSGHRAAAFCLLGALGLFVGGRVAARESAEAARLALQSPDAFSTVRVELEDGWIARPDGAWRLRARAFEIVDETRPDFRVDKKLYLLLYDTPPDLRSAGHLVARGFLRRLEGGAYILSVKSSKLVSTGGRASAFDPRSWNRWLAGKLEAAAGESERAREGNALVQALVLGRGGLVSWEVIDLYQRGGTYHLLVFSGVQIAMMAALARWILIRLRWRRAADLTLILICALMPRFVGSDPSVSRSALMIGLLLGCWLWRRPTDAANLVFVSALVRLILVPGDLADPGFALTYSATAGILVAGRALAEGRGRLGRVLAYGLGAELGTTPFTLYFFNRATIGGSVVTLLVSPILTLMLAAGFVASILAPFAPRGCRLLLEMVGRLNEPVLWVNRFVAEGARLSFVAACPATAVLLGGIIVAIVAASRGSKRSALVIVVAMVAPLGSSLFATLPDRTIEADVHFLDVGQGDATLATSRGRAILVDGGGSLTDPSFGTRTLLPLLAARRARTLDAVVLSHPHPDHCGGLRAVLRDLEVGRLILSRRHLATSCGRELVDAAMRRSIPIVDAESTRPFLFGEIEVEVFGTTHRYRRAWENNSSVIVRLAAGRRRVLLTGDIEREAERVLVEQERERLAADVLKVAHHGSRSSTTPAFLETVRPLRGVVSCGVSNRFGHPHAETEESLERARVRIDRTSVAGNLRFRFDGSRIFVQREFDSGRP